jgi:polar amino acid transport system substrate-binding protein
MMAHVAAASHVFGRLGARSPVRTRPGQRASAQYDFGNPNAFSAMKHRMSWPPTSLFARSLADPQRDNAPSPRAAARPVDEVRPDRPTNPRTSPTMNLPPRDIVAALTPTGALRASINLGNPILAGTDPATGAARGVSVDLATAFAERLGVPLQRVVFETAGQSVEAVANDKADIGFFAVDPVRGAGIGFTAPYVLIEGCYLVRDGSPLKDNAEVDRPGTRVVVGAGSAYDLHLSRELKHAQIVRAPSSPAVVDTFVQQDADVAAGVKQQLEADAKRVPGHRLLPGHFMVIRQAMGLPKGRGEAARAYLAAFVEEMKASGFVARALARHGIEGASVAPAA